MDKLDIRERGGLRNGVQQTSDKRLFMQLLCFADSNDCGELARELEKRQIDAVLYQDVNDAAGVALLTWSDCPDFFVTTLRQMLLSRPFAALTPKPEFSMLGRTYALGHEPDLEDWLLRQPPRRVTAPEGRWAVWYPLRRSGTFSALAPEEQSTVLREHGRIGHSFGEAGFAQDVRLACFGLDKHDNDFVIGLVGSELYPLSRCVQEMRKTQQTSKYIQNMGPFFVGRACWQASLGR